MCCTCASAATVLLLPLMLLLQNSLHDSLDLDGQLLMALGGKSVGKSFILRHIAQELKSKGELQPCLCFLIVLAKPGERTCHQSKHS